MLDSFCSYFLAFREQNRDTPALESRIVTEWDQDTMLSLRQGTVLELFVNSVRPDQVVTLPLDLLQRDEIAYHKRLEVKSFEVVYDG